MFDLIVWKLIDCHFIRVTLRPVLLVLGNQRTWTTASITRNQNFMNANGVSCAVKRHWINKTNKVDRCSLLLKENCSSAVFDSQDKKNTKHWNLCFLLRFSLLVIVSPYNQISKNLTCCLTNSLSSGSTCSLSSL